MSTSERMTKADQKKWLPKVRRIYMEFLERGDGKDELLPNLVARFGFVGSYDTLSNMCKDLPKTTPMPKAGAVGGGGDYPVISFGKGFVVRNGNIITA